MIIEGIDEGAHPLRAGAVDVALGLPVISLDVLDRDGLELLVFGVLQPRFEPLAEDEDLLIGFPVIDDMIGARKRRGDQQNRREYPDDGRPGFGKMLLLDGGKDDVGEERSAEQ